VTGVWRYDGETIRVLVLRETNYVELAESHVLPGFPIQEAIRLLEQRASMGEAELVRRFLSSIRAAGSGGWREASGEKEGS
jgi:hypothetical protein